MLNCDQCEYKCKKDNTLKKHKQTKHEEQTCKQCNKIFKTAMEMLMHVAKDHSSNIIEDVIEPRDLEQDKPTDVKQGNIIEEQLDNTICSICKEKLTVTNTLKYQDGKCTMCSILSYRKE